ncbi:MAG: tetratricopeptide repeat protein [Candidatus Lokiarchaeia archaeon]
MECEDILEKAKQAQEKGEIKEAIELYKQASECFENAGENDQLARTLTLLGELYTKKEDYFSAASAFKDAILRYLFSGNIVAAEEVSKNVTEEEIRGHHTFQFALNILEERLTAGELIFEEALTNEEMESALEQIGEKNEIIPADDAIYEIIGGKTDNFIPSVEMIQLTGKPTASQSQKLFRIALEKKRVKVKSGIISTITAKRGGEDFEVSFKNDIKNENSEFVAQVSFENTYDTTLKNAIFTCYIPACYKVEKIDSKIQVKTEPVLEGMEARFDLKKLSPKEKIDVNFTLERNISRTLIIGQGKEIWAVRTYVPTIQETPTRFKSHLVFQNKTEKGMDYVIVEDIIPLEFSILEIAANNVQPYAKEIEDTILQWKLSKFEKDNKLEITYLLERRKTVRIIEKQLQLKDGRNIGRLTKIIEPIDEQGKFLVSIEFQNTTHADLKEVKIKDMIPLNQKLVKATIDAEMKTSEKMHYLSWQFGNIMEGQSIEISYLTEGEESPYMEAPEIEIKKYQSYEIRRISTEQYSGILKESEATIEFKKSLN